MSLPTSIQKVFAGVFLATGAAAVARRVTRLRGGRLVLEFHGVCRYHEPGLPRAVQPILTEPELRSILRWLGRRFEFLTPMEFLRGGRHGVLLTFDDGLANNLDVVLPVLEVFDAPAVFFITTGPAQGVVPRLPFIEALLEKHGIDPVSVAAGRRRELFESLDSLDIARCAAHPLVTIGAHTVRHSRLPELSDGELRGELQGCREFLEGITKVPIDLFAYPFGAYDDRVLSAVREAGFLAAFVERSRKLGNEMFEIPRIGLYAASGPYLSAKTCGFHGGAYFEKICK